MSPSPADWVLPGVDPDPGHGDRRPIEWNGERLFQAAKFGTETQYQHIVFDEFARYVAPAIHLAGNVNVHIDPAITLGIRQRRLSLRPFDAGREHQPLRARCRWQAGHRPPTGQPLMTQEGLIQAFTNPMQFASDPNMTADIVLGTVNQVSNSIDEFVTGSLQNNLLGLPLDLAALNIARGRDTGVAPLNLARNQLFAESGETPAQALCELG